MIIKNFTSNIGVAFRCLVMAFFHIAHAFIPCKYTSHLHWGFDFKLDLTSHKNISNEKPNK